MVRKLVLLLAAFVSGMLAADSNYIYILNTHVPSSSRMDGLTACYQGSSHDLSKGSVIIEEGAKRCTFALVVGEVFEPFTQDGIITALKRVEDFPYRWFDFVLDIEVVKKDQTSESCYVWRIKERNKTDLPLKLPENAIVLQAHPDVVEKVLQTHQSSINETILYLPTIFIKENTTLENSSLYATMSLIDLRTFNRSEKASRTTVPNSCVTISACEKGFCPS